ncbi:MAG: TetR family transcriptional regulator C-terminal domain-containing protein, partial [Boseongicola sp.]|nr:TetR family transcriptional regulator C-terminal domain-containing protein [Boseongicola sp.]
RELVDEKASIIQQWIDDGKLARIDPHHLIFSIWATTQHYADFDVQVRMVLNASSDSHFDDAKAFLTDVYTRTLTPTND